MGRCKHDGGNIVIGETGHEEIEWELHDGRIESHDSNPGSIESTVSARCLDCGYSGRYNRYSDHLPVWVASALDRIVNHSREDLEEVVRKHKQELQEQTERTGIISRRLLTEEDIKRINSTEI
jgi:hypothetical protein